VLDQEGSNGEPLSYTDGSAKITAYCDEEVTNGIFLASLSQALDNRSCKPSIYNAGNYYNYYSATIGDGADTVCSKGWTLSANSGQKSFDNLIQTYRNLNTYLPISIINGGSFSNNDALFRNRGQGGIYRITGYNVITIGNTGLGPDYVRGTNFGDMIRCVAR